MSISVAANTQEQIRRMILEAIRADRKSVV